MEQVIALGIALVIAVIIVAIFIFRQIKKRNQDSQAQDQPLLSPTAKKTIVGGTAIGAGSLATYSIWASPLGIYAAVALTLGITVILFIVIKALRTGEIPFVPGGSGSGGLFGGGGKDLQDKIDKAKDRLQKKKDQYDRWGWQTKWASPDGSWLRVHKGDKTIIYLVDKETGKLVSYDPMELFRFSEGWYDDKGEYHKSTTFAMGGYDVYDLDIEYDPDTGTKTWTTPDGEVVLVDEGSESGVPTEPDTLDTKHQFW